ncbi:MAG TPA: hypothetical protein VMI56_17030, partial [Reyranella sp.]|nr:hypothetical protein [Reyranella sp.]
FPAWKVNGSEIQARLADDSAFTQTHVSYTRLDAKTTSTLTSCSGVGNGGLAFVTDATSTAHGSTYSGSGGNKVLLVCDGTNWIVQ